MKSVLLVFALAFTNSSELLAVTINTNFGQIQGSTIHISVHNFQVINKNTSVHTFLGIPFAQPPIGDLRFQKPQPVQKWSGIYNATKMPPACVQYVDYPFPGYDFEDGKSEDCLYLNIWVPSSNSRKLPVMVWIYGGSFTVGSIRKEIYDGSVLAALGGVIVVTFNYRLAAFGFLTFGTKEAPGNVGIYDMVEALKWVNKSIAAFGGDPNQVTLFGESSGAISIGLLCVSPLTKGLFHRIIMESASPVYFGIENSTENFGLSQQLAKAVGCASDDIFIRHNSDKVIRCLRGVNASDLAKTLASFNPTSANFFFPIYGDDVLPYNAREAVINGSFHNVDVLIGNNHDEGVYQITTANPDIFGFFGKKDGFVNKSCGSCMIRDTVSSAIPDPELVAKHYLDDVDDKDLELIRRQVCTASGDYNFFCPSVYFAESYSAKFNKVYYYFFVHRPSITPWAEWVGVTHFSEIPFVFGIPLLKTFNYTQQEMELSERIVQMWSNFAKYGEPHASWPLYSRKNPVYVKLNVTGSAKYTSDSLQTGHGPHKNNCDFFRKYFACE